MDDLNSVADLKTILASGKSPSTGARQPGGSFPGLLAGSPSRGGRELPMPRLGAGGLSAGERALLRRSVLS